MNLVVEFSGGLELLFNKNKILYLNSIPCETIEQLLLFLKDNYLTERAELFLSGSTIRPGVLVLINKVDWELEGQLSYKLKNQDTITFISTLHGG